MNKPVVRNNYKKKWEKVEILNFLQQKEEESTYYLNQIIIQSFSQKIH